MNTAYIAIGSNSGDRRAYIIKALSLLASLCGAIVKQSSVYETAAWGETSQPDFLNLVVAVETELSPLALLEAIQAIELQLGRQRTIKWGERTLDLDIIYYNQEVLTFPELTVPHPFMQNRLFVLVPLSEIAPTYLHPQLHVTNQELLLQCTDSLPIKMWSGTLTA